MIFFVAAKGQSKYADAMKMGDDAFKRKEYKKAINLYFAAEAFDPSKKDIIKDRVNKVFDMIETLRKEAENAKRVAIDEKNKADAASYSARQSQIEMSIVLEDAQRLIKAVYFYAGRFAVGFNGFRYYFIDKAGEWVRKLGIWNNIEQFGKHGYAKTNIGFDVLLDTFGVEYRSVYKIENLDDRTEAMILSASQWDTITSFAFKGEKLKVLVLEGKTFGLPSPLKKISEGLKRWQNLESFQLYSCKIDSLPLEIGELKQLQKLTLSETGIRRFPETFANLKNLTDVKIEFNDYLDSIPGFFGEFKKLVTLDLGENGISYLSPRIGELEGLTILNLSGNLMKNLPLEISRLKNLTTLWLNNTFLDELPKQVCELQNLITLGVSSNNLTRLPPDISKLTSLTSLDLGKNNITHLPDEIRKLVNLTTLDLRNNPLDVFPDAILELKNLSSLNLSYTGLTHIPANIRKLENLRSLELRSNEISREELDNIQRLLPRCIIKIY